MPDLLRSEGKEGLEWWMAFFEAFEPHLAEDRRAAKVAFYAANQFAKPIPWPTMAENFGVGHQSARAARTLDALPAVMEAIGHAMPDHIRKRFL